MEAYVSFLRGINVGGNKKVPMTKLVGVFEKNGFKNVKTLLASGNVVFSGNSNQIKKIPIMLEKAFGFEINTITLPFETIEMIVELNPFKNINATSKTRFYITFTDTDPKGKIKIPYESADKSFKILKIINNAIISVLDLSKNSTPDAMNILERTFGKSITTRNFNTVVKIANLNI